MLKNNGGLRSPARWSQGDAVLPPDGRWAEGERFSAPPPARIFQCRALKDFMQGFMKRFRKFRDAGNPGQSRGIRTNHLKHLRVFRAAWIAKNVIKSS